LSDAQRKLYADQTVPTLKELLQLAMTRNLNILLDIKSIDLKMCKGHPYEDKYGQAVVDAAHQLMFPNEQVQH